MDGAIEGTFSGKQIGKAHSEGFNKALDAALHKLDGKAHADKKFHVHYFVTITPNPGGVGQYSVELKPVGGGG